MTRRVCSGRTQGRRTLSSSAPARVCRRRLRNSNNEHSSSLYKKVRSGARAHRGARLDEIKCVLFPSLLSGCAVAQPPVPRGLANEGAVARHLSSFSQKRDSAAPSPRPAAIEMERGLALHVIVTAARPPSAGAAGGGTPSTAGGGRDAQPPQPEPPRIQGQVKLPQQQLQQQQRGGAPLSHQPPGLQDGGPGPVRPQS